MNSSELPSEWSMGRVLGSPAKLESAVEALPNARQACCAQAPIFWVKLVVFCKKNWRLRRAKGTKGPATRERYAQGATRHCLMSISSKRSFFQVGGPPLTGETAFGVKEPGVETAREQVLVRR